MKKLNLARSRNFGLGKAQNLQFELDEAQNLKFGLDKAKTLSTRFVSRLVGRVNPVLICNKKE